MNKIINPETAFSAEEREQLLATCLPAMARRERVVEMVEGGDDHTKNALRPELDRLNDQIRSACEEYQARLPIVELSRCPFTRELWSHSFDPYGVDGLWWNYYKPIRLLAEPLGGRFFSFRGAMVAPPEALQTCYLVSPGPDVPFIIERLMQLSSVAAVISHIRIGSLDAYPIVYYSSVDLIHNHRSNDWGTDFYSYRTADGHYEQGQHFDAEDEFQYNLEPWVEKNRLQWIEPGDDTLTLRTGVRDCPYLNLEGQKAVWRSKSGRLWWGPKR